MADGVTSVDGSDGEPNAREQLANPYKRHRGTGPISGYFGRIADAGWFQSSVRFVILLAGVTVGLETYPSITNHYGTELGVLNEVILWIFVLELVIKFAAEGTRPWNFFTDAWNVFDFAIVAVAFLPIDAEYVAVVRLARLLRFLRLVRALPRLRILVTALLKSIPSMGYVALLLLMLFYIYAVSGVFLFGANDPIHFSSLPIAMLSLFRVVTGEDWTDVMYIQMYGCDNYGYEGKLEELCTDPSAYPVFAALFFVTFMLVGSLIILNLFIGVIMTSMDEAKTENTALEMLEQHAASGTEIQTVEYELHALEQSLAEMMQRVSHLQVYLDKRVKRDSLTDAVRPLTIPPKENDAD